MLEALVALGQIRDVLTTAFAAARKANNADLLLRIAEAQTAAADVQIEVARLKDENRQLKEQADLQGKLNFRNNAYYLENDGPFCSSCWDANRKLVHVHTSDIRTSVPGMQNNGG